jgi:hypothetical protein
VLPDIHVSSLTELSALSKKPAISAMSQTSTQGINYCASKQGGYTAEIDGDYKFFGAGTAREIEV